MPGTRNCAISCHLVIQTWQHDIYIYTCTYKYNNMYSVNKYIHTTFKNCILPIHLVVHDHLNPDRSCFSRLSSKPMKIYDRLPCSPHSPTWVCSCTGQLQRSPGGNGSPHLGWLPLHSWTLCFTNNAKMVAYNYVTCACHSSQWSTPMDSISTVHSITACSLCSLCWCGNHRSTGMVLPSPLIACPLIAIMNTCWIIVRDIDIEISQNDLKHMASDRTNKHLESLSSYLLYPSKTTSDQNPPANSWQSSSKKSIYIYIYL